MFHAIINDAIVDVLFFDKLRDGTTLAHPVDGSQMVVMAIFYAFLGIDVLSKCCSQISTL